MNTTAQGTPAAPSHKLLAAGGKAAAVIRAVAKATGSLIFQATMMLIALFFLLWHGKQLVAWLDSVLPLPHRQTRELLNEFKNVSYAVVISTLVSSTVQTAAALIGYFIARVPHPLFFGALTFFVAFIPAIGATSVCLLAALFLFTTGHSYTALFLVIWGLAVVGTADNLVKPLLIQRGMNVSSGIVLFALVGGLSAFGAAGLLLGPLVAALFLALVRIYQRDYKQPAHP
jgi:predicted PurR-regulated permease PerM